MIDTRDSEAVDEQNKDVEPAWDAFALLAGVALAVVAAPVVLCALTGLSSATRFRGWGLRWWGFAECIAGFVVIVLAVHLLRDRGDPRDRIRACGRRGLGLFFLFLLGFFFWPVPVHDYVFPNFFDTQLIVLLVIGLCAAVGIVPFRLSRMLRRGFALFAAGFVFFLALHGFRIHLSAEASDVLVLSCATAAAAIGGYVGLVIAHDLLDEGRPRSRRAGWALPAACLVGLGALGSPILVLVALLLVCALGGIAGLRGGSLGGIAFVLAVLLVAVLSLAYLVVDRLTGTGFNEAVLYHWRYGLGGAGLSDYLLLSATAITTVLAIAVFAWFRMRRAPPDSGGPARWPRRMACFALLGCALLVSPAVLELAQLRTAWAPDDRIDPQQLREFQQAYQRPTIERIGERRNLVVIFAESLERAYFDQARYPDLLPRLRELETGGISFADIRQVPGTGWTVAGMTASLCGIPLFTPTHGNAMAGVDRFLPSATAFTDLLAADGYRCVYIAGAALRFAGKGQLLRSHGFDRVWGFEELRARGLHDRPEHPWGLYDDDVFAAVYEQFEQLGARDEPFALFTLTTGTHFPEGHRSARQQGERYGDGADSLLNALRASDSLLADFIARIRSSRYGDETTIVLCSDHLTMGKAAVEQLGQVGERRNTWIIFPPGTANGRRVETIGSLLDFGPTVLPFIGYRCSLGLGRNLLDRQVASSSAVVRIQQSLHRWRSMILGFWGFPRIRERIRFSAEPPVVQIDDRRFEPPVLIELDASLQTTLKFNHYAGEGAPELSSHLDGMPADQHFILFARRIEAGRFREQSYHDGYVAVFGMGGKSSHVEHIAATREFSVTAIRELLGLPPAFAVRRVAHAGSSIDGMAYSNSIEALDSGFRKGFRYFELDFSFTSDDQLVCLHDWDESFQRLFGVRTRKPLSAAAFREMVRTRGRYHPPTLPELARWMRAHPDAVIVTDCKSRNLHALAMIAEALPDAARRVIPQIYQPEEFEPVRALGFQQLIWTLYRFYRSDRAVLDWIDESHRGPLAVTMPRQRAADGLPHLLRTRGIPSYVHTVNDPGEAALLTGALGVSEIYTDVLAPDTESASSRARDEREAPSGRGSE